MRQREEPPHYAPSAQGHFGERWAYRGSEHPGHTGGRPGRLATEIKWIWHPGVCPGQTLTEKIRHRHQMIAKAGEEGRGGAVDNLRWILWNWCIHHFKDSADTKIHQNLGIPDCRGDHQGAISVPGALVPWPPGRHIRPSWGANGPEYLFFWQPNAHPLHPDGPGQPRGAGPGDAWGLAGSWGPAGIKIHQNLGILDFLGTPPGCHIRPSWNANGPEYWFFWRSNDHLLPPDDPGQPRGAVHLP
eukprot:gene10797-biopygen9364